MVPSVLRRAGALACVILGLSLGGCGKWTKVLWPGEPVLNPCDPVSNLYWKGNHYIERDYVKEDGTLDYLRWFKARKVQTSRCDPVTGKQKAARDRGKPSTVPRTNRDRLPELAPTQTPRAKPNPAGVTPRTPQ